MKLLFNCLIAVCLVSSMIYSDVSIKHGRLTQDDVWSGTIHIVGDVEIPKGICVTVKPNTEIIFAEIDLYNLGKDPYKCEIIVNGILDTQGDEKNPITFKRVGENQYELLPWDNNTTAVIHFAPYTVETESLREEFHGFKLQYFSFWSLVFGLWIMRS